MDCIELTTRKILAGFDRLEEEYAFLIKNPFGDVIPENLLEQFISINVQHMKIGAIEKACANLSRDLGRFVPES